MIELLTPPPPVRDLPPVAPRMEPKRIAILLPGLGAGGTERVVNFLANRWAGQGRTVTIITLEPADAESYYRYHSQVRIRRLGIPPSRTSSGGALTATARRIRALRAALRETAPELAISFLTRMNILALIAGTALRFSIIVSERNNPQAQDVGPVWRKLRNNLYPRAFGLVTMTSGAMQAFPAKLRRRSWVIPNPAELPTGIAAPRLGRKLVAVGRLVEQKGFDLLLEAFALIAPRHPEWSLCIWGEGPDRVALEAQSRRLGLEERVTMPGVTAQPGGWIADADAFVLSSRYEGWGIVLLEAMAAGLPVASFACDFGPEEMVTHGSDGLLAPPGDVAGLAMILDQLLGDAALRERLAARAKVSAARFAPDAVGKAWDDVVAETVTNGVLA